MIRPDDYIAQADYDLTPARHRRDIAPAGVAHQAATDRSRQRRVAAMGRVLALNVSHNGYALSDGANFGKLGLISRLACERGWPLPLRGGPCPRDGLRLGAAGQVGAARWLLSPRPDLGRFTQ